MRYRVALSYSVEVKANDQGDALRDSVYEAAYKPSVKNLVVRIISETADDPKPVVAAAPHQHTDLTVKDDAPVTGTTGGPINPFAVDPKPVSPEHEVGDIGYEPQNKRPM